MKKQPEKNRLTSFHLLAIFARVRIRNDNIFLKISKLYFFFPPIAGTTLKGSNTFPACTIFCRAVDQSPAQHLHLL